MPRIACAREPYFRKVGAHYVVGIVYCDTDHFKPPVQNTDQRNGLCMRFGGYASWRRCSSCDHQVGYTEERHAAPKMSPVICNAGDMDHNPRRRVCRVCKHSIMCLSEKIERTENARIKLIKIRTKKAKLKIVP